MMMEAGGRKDLRLRADELLEQLDAADEGERAERERTERELERAEAERELWRAGRAARVVTSIVKQ